MKNLLCASVLFVGWVAAIHAAELHVAISGKDDNSGTKDAPLRTIQHAAELALPGDTVTVHAGVYRECVNPPRGGQSDAKRIVYQAAPGEQVEIKGSEVVKGWEKVAGDTWKATVPNALFGEVNPYSDVIHGDWCGNPGYHTGAVYLNGQWLTESLKREPVMAPLGSKGLWYAQVKEKETSIWAHFKGVDPNQELVEINVRRCVFYPDKPGRNYITVRGFALRHAATPWAPPTAEQIAMIGTHWSKGWIIENNTISHSVSAGVSLGKFGDEHDNAGATPEAYDKAILRALAKGWNKAAIGGHVVRNNEISHCEQAGIVGSMGAAFSTVTGNSIHDIHVRRQWGGFEQAGIKIHGALDVEISRNHIYRTFRGIWLDWMAQNARISANLLHENAADDLFLEANHGPVLVDNNIFLSATAFRNVSHGVVFVHNLVTGQVAGRTSPKAGSPFFKPHSTIVDPTHRCAEGNDRFYNNLFVGTQGLDSYDAAKSAPTMAGNVFLLGARPSKHEADALRKPEVDPAVKLVEKADGVYLDLTIKADWVSERRRYLVTTELLGKASDAPYENPDGSPLRIDTDYFGNARNGDNPMPGPFEIAQGGRSARRVWPPDARPQRREPDPQPLHPTQDQSVDLKQRAAALKDLKWGMFVCWSFSTFSGKEWSPGIKDVAFFRATEADTDQWARTAKEAGMGYILFLAKHHDGFCLWDTQTTDRKVTRAPLGRDVLAELKKSCDKHGLKLALYFSHGDWTWPGAQDGKGGGAGKRPEVGGHNPEQKKAQLKELLTRYGPIEFIWFDTAAGNGGLSDEETAAWVKSLQPGCFVGGCGGVSDLSTGEGGKPQPVSKPLPIKEFTYQILPPHKGGAGWFYSLPIHDELCWPAGAIYRDYLKSVEYGNIFSLNVGPNYQGRLREIDVATLQQVGRMIQEKAPMPGNIFGSLSFGKVVTASSTLGAQYTADRCCDDDFRGTAWVAGLQDARSSWVQIDLGENCEVGAAVVQETGWNTKDFAIEYKDGETWKSIVTGTTMVNGKAYMFPPVKSRHFRLIISKSEKPASIREFQLYAPGTGTPRWIERVNIAQVTR